MSDPINLDNLTEATIQDLQKGLTRAEAEFVVSRLKVLGHLSLYWSRRARKAESVVSMLSDGIYRRDKNYARAKAKDKLFITEILNDLHRHGFDASGGKARDMLHDWARELGEEARVIFPATRLRKHHAARCGAENW